MKLKLLAILFSVCCCSLASAAPRNVLIQCNSVGPILSGIVDLPLASECQPSQVDELYKLVCPNMAYLEYTVQGSKVRYESSVPMEIWPAFYSAGKRHVWEKSEVDQFGHQGFPGLDYRQPFVKLVSTAGYPVNLNGLITTPDGNTIVGFALGDCTARIPN